LGDGLEGMEQKRRRDRWERKSIDQRKIRGEEYSIV
jgi:hypothetical protein